MEGYRLFLEEGQAGEMRGVTLYISGQLESMELCLGPDEKSLWVRIKGRTGTGDIVVGVSYRPPDQEDRADEAHYRQTGAASRSQFLVLVVDFNHSDNQLEGQRSRA